MLRELAVPWNQALKLHILLEHCRRQPPLSHLTPPTFPSLWEPPFSPSFREASVFWALFCMRPYSGIPESHLLHVA